MGRFTIRQVKTGIKFDLKAANGQTVLSSEVYTGLDACRKGMESVRKVAPTAPVEDRTEETAAPVPHPKFELYRDKSGLYRFRLKSRNGKVIGVSDTYRTKAGALEGIESVKINASGEIENA